MRSPAMETLEKPMPIGSDFQTCLGPSVGHSLSKFLSGEMPSRLGPRNCGHSGAATTKEEHAAARTTRLLMRNRRDISGAPHRWEGTQAGDVSIVVNTGAAQSQNCLAATRRGALWKSAPLRVAAKRRRSRE